MELKDKKILVVGLGKTGQDTARFLIRRGAQVKASDSSTREKLGPVFSEMSSLGVDVEAGIHTDETFLWADLIVLSPGVPFSIPQIKTALKNGTEVISEVELASRFINTPIIAITGSNGKTTTSTLIAKILERNSKKVFLGANIGTPLIQIADTAEQFDILVLELSSFQLQGVTTFRPEIAVILNITPNHLDHHKSFEEYVQSKLKIYSNQSEQDWFIYNGEDIEIISHLNEVKSHQIPFGESNLDGIKYDGSNIIFRDHSYSVSETKLLGAHNIENIMAAIAGTAILGCDPKLIQEAIDHFEPLEHRNEYIGKLGGANVYNDSKSTSPAATQKALESLTPPIILIAGGKDKGVSFEPLKTLIKEKVRLLVLIGESSQRMNDELGQGVESHISSSLKEALEFTRANVKSDDSILFSPACSSFDMFNSYEDRGSKFKEIVESL